MSDFIPLSIPNIGEVEKKYVLEALDDGWVSTVGSQVNQFEKMFAEYVGVKHAVACASGTAALHVALLLSGVERDDEVLVPDMTFVATANAVAYIGAQPVFLDVDQATLGINVEELVSFLNSTAEKRSGFAYNKETGRRIKAILPVHMLGTPVDMDPLTDICKDFNISVVEDATESLGASYKGKRAGGLSDIACFSFNGNKIITTGGGGMITTNDEALAAKAKHLTTTAKTDPVFFEHDEVGFNYRLVNILAALGLGQMERLDSFVARKKEIHHMYMGGLSRMAHATLFKAPDEYDSNYWLNMVMFSESVIEKYTLRELVDFFTSKGIQTRPMWTLLSSLPMYRNCFKAQTPISENIYKRSLTIPSGTGITDQQVGRVIEAIGELS